MLSWVWILWLRTLCTVLTCSFRMRCSVVGPNLPASTTNQDPHGSKAVMQLEATLSAALVTRLHRRTHLSIHRLYSSVSRTNSGVMWTTNATGTWPPLWYLQMWSNFNSHAYSLASLGHTAVHQLTTRWRQIAHVQYKLTRAAQTFSF